MGLAHIQGDTLAWDMIMYADATKAARLNLTGWTLTAKAQHSSGVAVAPTVVVGDAVNGVVSLTLDAATTAAMATGNWRVQIQRQDGGGITRTTGPVPFEIEEDLVP